MINVKVNKISKSLILLFFVTFTLFASGCTEKNLSADEIATQMIEKEDSIEDYSYVMNATYYYGEKTTITEFKTMFKKPNLIKNIAMESGKENGTLLVSDGEFRWTYVPNTNTVLKTKIPEIQKLDKSEYAQLIGDLLNDTNVTLLGMEDVDNRSTFLLETTPKETAEDYQLIGRTKIWVDKETWMPLRYEICDSKKNLIMKIEIRDLKVNTGIPDSEFVFDIPEGAKIQTVDLTKGLKQPEELTLEEAREQASFEILTPEYMPEGYAFNYSTVYNYSEVVSDSQETETITLIYTNEEASIILAETLQESQPQDSAILGNGEDVEINGIKGKYLALGDMKLLKWKLGNIYFTLNAPLEKAEILKIANSISAKK
jgi:outer membrane lipoprotein-sorting protein